MRHVLIVYHNQCYTVDGVLGPNSGITKAEAAKEVSHGPTSVETAPKGTPGSALLNEQYIKACDKGVLDKEICDKGAPCYSSIEQQCFTATGQLGPNAGITKAETAKEVIS